MVWATCLRAELRAEVGDQHAGLATLSFLAMVLYSVVLGTLDLVGFLLSLSSSCRMRAERELFFGCQRSAAYGEHTIYGERPWWRERMLSLVLTLAYRLFMEPSIA